MQIVDTLGFNKTITYFIQAPPYVVAYIATLVVSWSSGRYLEHCFHIIGAMLACLIGAVIMISTLNVGARYFSLFLLCTGPFIGLNVSLEYDALLLYNANKKLDSNSMGNNRGTSSSNQTCRPHCYCKLRVLGLALVFAILLSSIARAQIRDWRRCHYHRLWPLHHNLPRYPMVLPKEEQGD